MTNARTSQTVHCNIRPEVWKRRHDGLARSVDTSTLNRELPNGHTLPLTYVRRGPRTSTPVLVIPGGPGLASIMPYQRFRTAASQRGLDLLMVEHRGVGMSRKTADGTDLDPEAITIAGVLDDVIAVLNAEQIDQVIVYGSSYGSYLAGALGTLIPDRIKGMILDSPMLDAHSKHETSRELNRLYWHGIEETAGHASRIRGLIESGAFQTEMSGFPIQLLHESGGPDLVAKMLNLVERGKGQRAWSWMNRLGASDVCTSRPFLMEFDLVARSAFTELGYGLRHNPAWGPLRSDHSFDGLTSQFPAFMREPVDIRGALPNFAWPVVVLSGDWDLRTPRTVAHEVIAGAPQAILAPIARQGHSALDTAQSFALAAIQHLVRTPDDAPPLDMGHLTAPKSMMNRLISLRLTLASLTMARNYAVAGAATRRS